MTVFANAFTLSLILCTAVAFVVLVLHPDSRRGLVYLAKDLGRELTNGIR